MLCVLRTHQTLPSLALGFRSAVVVGQFEHDFAGVFALVVQTVPCVVAASSWNHDLVQIDPCLSYQVRLLVVVEYRHFEVAVVGRLVHGEAEFLVPANWSALN